MNHLHESEQIDLMNRVARIFQTKHFCSAEFSNWKVTDMTVAELQFVALSGHRQDSGNPL
jgi:hypothetical protein